MRRACLVLSLMKKSLVRFALIWGVAPPPYLFFDGEVLFIDGLPVGGAYVTNDIARGSLPRRLCRTYEDIMAAPIRRLR